MDKLIKILLKFVEDYIVRPEQRPPTVPTLRLVLDRVWFTERSTVGRLSIDGEFQCFTLEDEDKLRRGQKKVYGVTAIPFGKYEIDITYSPKYKRQMPLVKNVPGFTGIRIHSGNKAEDSEGCILVGRTRAKNWIGQSRLAYKALFKKLEQAKKDGKKIAIEVR